MELLKFLSTSEIAAQMISFFILLFLLRIFVWKRLVKLLDDRKERIASEFRNIENSKIEIEKLKSDYENSLSSIDKESRKKIQEAIIEGKKLAEEIKKSAYHDAQRIIERAREDVKYEFSKAKEEIKDKIIELSISAAETVIQDKLTEEEDRKIVKDFIDKIDTIE